MGHDMNPDELRKLVDKLYRRKSKTPMVSELDELLAAADAWDASIEAQLDARIEADAFKRRIEELEKRLEADLEALRERRQAAFDRKARIEELERQLLIYRNGVVGPDENGELVIRVPAAALAGEEKPGA